jgi:PAS domain S-box-containing protein
METGTLFPPLIALGINLVIAWIATRNSKKPGAVSLIFLSLSLAMWSLFLLTNRSLSGIISNGLWMEIIYLCIVVVASAQLIFSFSYREKYSRIPRLILVILCIIPFLIQALFWAFSLKAVFSEAGAGISFPPAALPEVWVKINSLYIYTLVSASVVLVISTSFRNPRPLVLRSWAILVGSIVPFIIIMLELININPWPQFEFSLLGFTVAGMGFAYGIFSRGPNESWLVPRDIVVEGMSDGWIVLDTNYTIVDINPAAERIVGLPRGNLYGRPIQFILGDFTIPKNLPGGIQEMEMRRSVKSQLGFRNLNIRISPLLDRDSRQFGHLIVWRDNTERKLAEEARQRARDEMFVLLNAISSAASNAMSLEDFLLESIYQIIYPFRSQVVAIFLMVEKTKKDEAQRLSLVSHFGLPPEAIKSLSHLPVTSPLFDWAYKNRQSYLIENISNDSHLPLALREMHCSCFLVMPFITPAGEERKTIGFLCLGRKEKPVFSQDEVIRLTAISDHIATLIDSDRRRKLAIALSERKRLERDLHDSVSQKLYGLVTLTEAAHAALEAGSKVDPFEIISRIGEHARQAVKEMRLFLFQPQLMDIEKDGLVYVLHQRLAAVEGRADVKARFLADEKISLSKDKEIALYFIAQEALNNALRHARAKSVTVTLKEGRRNVILQIVDDGCGFDPENAKRGGLGLRNMKERAMMMNGKFAITSRAQKGTKVVITLPKDEPVSVPARDN